MGPFLKNRGWGCGVGATGEFNKRGPINFFVKLTLWMQIAQTSVMFNMLER
jgi:hypothetical protein